MRRTLRSLVVGWLGLYAAVNLAALLTGVVARRVGKDPRAHGQGWPDVRNLRVVDDRLVVGAQPSPEDYRQLADKGVTSVVNLRAGGASDPVRDDPDQLASLGLHHASVPIHDGWAPTAEQMRQVLDLVDLTPGPTFAHCGGGVGRAGSIAAAHLARNGRRPSLVAQLATGPPSLEQIWFIAAGAAAEPPRLVRRVSRVIDAPRLLWARLAPRR